MHLLGIVCAVKIILRKTIRKTNIISDDPATSSGGARQKL